MNVEEERKKKESEPINDGRLQNIDKWKKRKISKRQE